MPLKVTCPRCKKLHRNIDKRLLGKKFQCDCGKIMRLGSAGDTPATKKKSSRTNPPQSATARKPDSAQQKPAQPKRHKSSQPEKAELNKPTAAEPAINRRKDESFKSSSHKTAIGSDFDDIEELMRMGEMGPGATLASSAAHEDQARDVVPIEGMADPDVQAAKTLPSELKIDERDPPSPESVAQEIDDSVDGLQQSFEVLDDSVDDDLIELSSADLVVYRQANPPGPVATPVPQTPSHVSAQTPSQPSQPTAAPIQSAQAGPSAQSIPANVASAVNFPGGAPTNLPPGYPNANNPDAGANQVTGPDAHPAGTAPIAPSGRSVYVPAPNGTPASNPSLVICLVAFVTALFAIANLVFAFGQIGPFLPGGIESGTGSSASMTGIALGIGIFGSLGLLGSACLLFASEVKQLTGGDSLVWAPLVVMIGATLFLIFQAGLCIFNLTNMMAMRAYDVSAGETARSVVLSYVLGCAIPAALLVAAIIRQSKKM